MTLKKLAMLTISLFAMPALAQLCTDVLLKRHLSSSGRMEWAKDRVLYYRFNVPEDGARKSPVLLIGGLDSDFATTNTTAQKLFNQGIPVIQVELKGQGQTLKDLQESRLEIPLHEQVEDLQNLLHELQIDNLSVMGFSYGGAVAAALAKENHRVQNVYLVSSFTNEAEFHDPHMGAVNYLTKQYMSFWGLEKVYQHTIDTGTRWGLRTSPYNPLIAGDYLKGEGSAALYSGTEGFNFTDALKEAKATVHVIHSKFDPIAPVEGIRRAFAQLPPERQGQFEVTAHVTHHLPVYATDDVVDLIVNNYRK